ncbi:MAG: MFS transporter [Bdellovibrionales bacterium]|nr:MFS transporter [Bdellovibrionales bacterium]
MTNQTPTFTGYQKQVVALLAFLQFTVVLDFMILSPLGAILMPAMQITPAQFGAVVSAYAFSAGLSGLLAAGFADRYDRKSLLLFFYTGFLLGTLFCALAPSYELLLAARIVTGIFGGVIGSVSFAIITDLFPLEKRGRVMGVVQTAFASSQILGIPLGLFFANRWGWHAPFLMIVAVGVAMGVAIYVRLKPINNHLAEGRQGKAFQHLYNTLTTRRYVQAFSTTALLATGGFMMMPFSSAFTVNNLGIAIDRLPLVYMITGICAIITGPLVGKLSDTYGKFPIFVFGSVLSAVMVAIYTHLGVTPIGWVILVSALMFVGISSRMVPSQALVSAIPAPSSRGAFMSINSSLQQVSGGVASALAGMIVTETAGGKLEHFDVIGYVVIGAMAITLVQMYFISRQVHERH